MNALFRRSKLLLPNILVKLIISINRRESIISASENVDIAIRFHKLHPDIICGVDLCGDPTSKHFSTFKAPLQIARDNGLKLALHCGEIENKEEIYEMLKFGMNRLGHGTFIKGNFLFE